MRLPDVIIGPFRQRDSVVITGTLRDETGAAIAGTSLDTMTFSLYSETDPYAILNSRDDVNIVANVDAAGLLTLLLTSDDMALEDEDNQTETHRALFEWTWTVAAAVHRGSLEVQILVHNLLKVPTA